MDGLLAGLVGAAVGTAIGLFNYRVILGILEPRLRAHDRSQTAAERAAFERKLVTLRRIVLVFEVAVLGGAGYFVGSMLGGWLGAAGG